MATATGDGSDAACIQCCDNLVNAEINALHAPFDGYAHLMPERLFAAGRVATITVMGHFQEKIMKSALTPTIAVAFALGVLFSLPQQGLAHGGGLNSAGCHNETATGGYHCHNDDEEDVDWGAVGAVAGGALALWLILDLMNDEEGQPLSGFSFTPLVGSVATGFIAEYDLDGLNRLGFGVQSDSVERKGTYSEFHWRLAF